MYLAYSLSHWYKLIRRISRTIFVRKTCNQTLNYVHPTKLFNVHCSVGKSIASPAFPMGSSIVIITGM